MTALPIRIAHERDLWDDEGLPSPAERLARLREALAANPMPEPKPVDLEAEQRKADAAMARLFSGLLTDRELLVVAKGHARFNRQNKRENRA